MERQGERAPDTTVGGSPCELRPAVVDEGVVDAQDRAGAVGVDTGSAAGVVLRLVDLRGSRLGEHRRRRPLPLHQRDAGHGTAVELIDGEIGDPLQERQERAIFGFEPRQTHELFDELTGILHEVPIIRKP